jgi:hypothetical protein
MQFEFSRVRTYELCLADDVRRALHQPGLLLGEKLGRLLAPLLPRGPLCACAARNRNSRGLAVLAVTYTSRGGGPGRN